MSALSRRTFLKYMTGATTAVLLVRTQSGTVYAAPQSLVRSAARGRIYTAISGPHA